MNKGEAELKFAEKALGLSSSYDLADIRENYSKKLLVNPSQEKILTSCKDILEKNYNEKLLNNPLEEKAVIEHKETVEDNSSNSTLQEDKKELQNNINILFGDEIVVPYYIKCINRDTVLELKNLFYLENWKDYLSYLNDPRVIDLIKNYIEIGSALMENDLHLPVSKKMLSELKYTDGISLREVKQGFSRIDSYEKIYSTLTEYTTLPVDTIEKIYVYYHKNIESQFKLMETMSSTNKIDFIHETVNQFLKKQKESNLNEDLTSPKI